MNHVYVLRWKILFRYCMRWGLLPPTRKIRECPWKKLYIQVFAHIFILSSFFLVHVFIIGCFVVEHFGGVAWMAYLIFILFETALELFNVASLIIVWILSFFLSLCKRDGEDMVELVRNCQNEFKEYYIQMQAAKRSQAPHPSQVRPCTTVCAPWLSQLLNFFFFCGGVELKLIYKRFRVCLFLRLNPVQTHWNVKFQFEGANMKALYFCFHVVVGLNA